MYQPFEALTYVTLTIIGDQGAGKTTLCNFLQNESYRLVSGRYESTIGANFQTVIQGSHKINMWDTAGQQRFRTVAAGYIGCANVVMICVDLISEQTFNHQSLDEFIGMVQPGQAIVIVGTKQREGEITPFQQQLETWCGQKGYPFLSVNPTSTSASEQRQALLAKVIELAPVAAQAVQQPSFELEADATPVTPLNAALRHFQSLLNQDRKHQDHQVELINAASSAVDTARDKDSIQKFQDAYLDHSGYSKAAQWVIAHHWINVYSKIALLCGAGVLGIAFAQISPLVGLVVAASSLFIAVVMEQGMAAKRGHLFGFFSPLDSAAANLMHACRAELR